MTPDGRGRQPNIVFVFADEWRAQATGYNGDVNCITPNMDALAERSVNVSRAVSGHPVCCPYRASLMTGQYPLTHGVFLNDVELDPHCRPLARIFAEGGYRTGYIGKWHLYGSPDGHYGRRRARVPRDYQLGFDDWWGFECCHDYWNSPYYHNEDPRKHMWDGYDLFAQADHAAGYIRQRAECDPPFLLMLSWGPPHFPLQTAPEPYRRLYADREIQLRPNVPEPLQARAEADLRGYYAHIAALDAGLQTVLDAIDQADIAGNTILIVTADHGEMAQSQGLVTKFVPLAESLRVPFLIRWPDGLPSGRACPIPLDAPDILPTLLSLAGLEIPGTVQGRDWSDWLRGDKAPTGEESAFCQVPAAYTEMCNFGLSGYRAVTTARYTYAENADGPWLLFDDEQDPYQMQNLIGRDEAADLQTRMRAELAGWLDRLDDDFLPGPEYLRRAGLDHYKEVHFPLIQQWSFPWDG